MSHAAVPKNPNMSIIDRNTSVRTFHAISAPTNSHVMTANSKLHTHFTTLLWGANVPLPSLKDTESLVGRG
eukprot:6173727-Amphidinium_carterae.1